MSSESSPLTPQQDFSLDQLRKQWLSSLIDVAEKIAPFDTPSQLEESDSDFWTTINQLKEADRLQNADFENGQTALCRIVSHFPQLMPHTARDLFWLFGGDCLHFMPDEEIAFFQRLDERRYECESEGQPFDYLMEKKRLSDQVGLASPIHETSSPTTH